ncbi:protein RDM1-like [Prosopis cineraria]|uniref:protein RDM1-like n=1 Tax=Prosopis cineraria TaxID=364024 RepID=UPI00240F2B19|nr:protein RDM1-like [Prosopis cineraria]
MYACIVICDDAEGILEVAKEYQKRMKKTPIPRARLSNAMAVNWQGLAKTLENSYGQPLHYLTHMLCKQWDKSRFGAEDGEKPLDSILSAEKAESILWEVEAVHRLSSSHVHLSTLWLTDPHFEAFVDQVILPPPPPPS